MRSHHTIVSARVARILALCATAAIFAACNQHLGADTTEQTKVQNAEADAPLRFEDFLAPVLLVKDFQQDGTRCALGSKVVTLVSGNRISETLVLSVGHGVATAESAYIANDVEVVQALVPERSLGCRPTSETNAIQQGIQRSLDEGILVTVSTRYYAGRATLNTASDTTIGLAEDVSVLRADGLTMRPVHLHRSTEQLEVGQTLSLIGNGTKDCFLPPEARAEGESATQSERAREYGYGYATLEVSSKAGPDFLFADTTAGGGIPCNGDSGAFMGTVEGNSASEDVELHLASILLSEDAASDRAVTYRGLRWDSPAARRNICAAIATASGSGQSEVIPGDEALSCP